jgi:hypothetical protein
LLERRGRIIGLNYHVFYVLTHFSDTGDEGEGDDGKPRSEKEKKEGEEKKSKPEINLGRLMLTEKVINWI